MAAGALEHRRSCPVEGDLSDPPGRPWRVEMVLVLSEQCTLNHCHDEAAALFAHWRVRGIATPADEALDTMIACALPKLVAKLACIGKVQSVGMSLGRRAAKRLWHLAPLRHLKASIVVPEPGSAKCRLSSGVFAALAGALDAWAPILQKVVAGECMEARADIEGELRRFQSWALQSAFALSRGNMLVQRVTAQGRLAKRRKSGSGKSLSVASEGFAGRYTDWFVLHSVLIWHGLLQDGYMDMTLELVVRTAFPKEIAKELLELMEGMPVPSPTSLSRWRLQVDAVYMLWQPS